MNFADIGPSAPRRLTAKSTVGLEASERSESAPFQTCAFGSSLPQMMRMRPPSWQSWKGSVFGFLLAILVGFTVVFDALVMWFAVALFSWGAPPLLFPTVYWFLALFGVIVTVCTIRLTMSFRRHQRELK